MNVLKRAVSHNVKESDKNIPGSAPQTRSSPKLNGFFTGPRLIPPPESNANPAGGEEIMAHAQKVITIDIKHKVLH